jgi:predicted nucleotidyltransferase
MQTIKKIRIYSELRGGLIHSAVAAKLGLSSRHFFNYEQRGAWHRTGTANLYEVSASMGIGRLVVDVPLALVDGIAAKKNTGFAVAGASALELVTDVVSFSGRDLTVVPCDGARVQAKDALTIVPCFWPQTPLFAGEGFMYEPVIFAMFRLFLAAHTSRFKVFHLPERRKQAAYWKSLSPARKNVLETPELLVPFICPYEVVAFKSMLANSQSEALREAGLAFLALIKTQGCSRTVATEKTKRLPAYKEALLKIFNQCPELRKLLPFRLLFNAPVKLSHESAEAGWQIKQTLAASEIADEVEGMVLFGSRARGNERTNSDFDLFVIAKDSAFTDKIQGWQGLIAEALQDNGMENFDLLISSPTAIQQEPLWFTLLSEGAWL